MGAFSSMFIKVNADLPSRLDRYLKRLYPTLSQGVIERALRLKQILVNSNLAKASLRVIENDEVFIDDKLSLVPKSEKEEFFSPSVIKLAEKIIKDYLVYDHEQFVAINKPASLATQGGSKIKLSIDDALSYLNYKSAMDFKLVHRLDKETSGLLLIAKNYLSSTKLAAAFQDKIIQKTYFAITLGRPYEETGEVSGLIGKNRGGTYEIVQSDQENGKLAITRYKLLKPLNNGLYLIEFTPLTGRTHQLRFHAKMLGCPIIGDTKYGNPQSILRSKQMLLHAKNIVMSANIFGREIIINTDLPEYFSEYINRPLHGEKRRC